jgi:predicted RNA-binding protein with RPS1 domain
LPLGVDGFVPLSQLSQTPIKNLAEAFQVGDSLPMSVIEFDGESKKIVLSVVEYLRGKEQSIIDDYVAKHKLPPITLKDALPIALTPEEKRAIDEEASLK